MKARIYKSDHNFMRHHAVDTGMPMADVIRQAVRRLVDGKFVVGPKDELITTTVLVPVEHEQKLKILSKETGVAIEEIVRLAVHDTVLTTIEALKEVVVEAAVVVDRHQALLDREEDEIAQKEKLAAKIREKMGK